MKCSKCGSDNTRKAGNTVTVNGPKQRYQCKDCGKTFYPTLCESKDEN